LPSSLTVPSGSIRSCYRFLPEVRQGISRLLPIDGFAPITLLPTPSATDIYNFSTNNTVPAGQPILLGYLAGNGFSFDSFTVTPVSEPTSLILLGFGLVAISMGASRRRK
jgi:hypothetical protein